MKINMRSPFVLVAAIALSALISLPLKGCGGGGSNPVFNDHASAVAIQSDGKIVAAGDSYNSNNGWCFALVRYNSNGSLDATFGNGGKVLTAIGAVARAVAIQSDGKIVAAGYDYAYSFVLVRYNSDGSLDTTFGNGGKVLTLLNGGALAVALQSDGKIVAAGYSYNGIGYDFALARYNSNGTLDAAFGSGGMVITSNSLMNSGASSVAIQIDGRIVAAGSSYNGFMGNYDFALTRYNIDGSPDITFAANGREVTTVMSLYTLGAATVVPDPISGKIVAAAYSPYQSVLTRHNSDGSPDTTFAFGGVLVMVSGSHWGNSSMVRDIAVQTDGRIVVAGSLYKDDMSSYDFAVERHNSDGSMDAGFGSGGVVITGM